jgi:transposase
METTKYYLGIDLHKKTSYWTLMNSDREIMYRKNLETSKEGVAQGVHEMGIAAQGVEAAIEPVSQWGWYGDMLEKEGFTVHLVDTYKTKLIASSKLKNDKVDATILAELMRTNFLPTAYRAPQSTRDLREFVRHRAFLVRIRSRMRNRIHQILWKHGIHSPYSDLLGKKGLEWLNALSLGHPYSAERDDLIELWKVFSARISSYDERCRFFASQSKEAGILMTIPGIGVITALIILAEVGDFSRFSSPEKLSSFAGMVSSSRSSGERTVLGHITHRGSVWLRTALVEATVTVNPKWGHLYDFYARIAVKKGVKVARVALARKILTVSWHLIQKGVPFNTTVGYSDSVKR